MQLLNTTLKSKSTGTLFKKKVQANNHGMLGGLSHVHQLDVQNSTKILNILKTSNSINFKSSIDLGCGIGRVSLQILSNFFEQIDLVEQNKDFLLKAKNVN